MTAYTAPHQPEQIPGANKDLVDHVISSASTAAAFRMLANKQRLIQERARAWTIALLSDRRRVFEPFTVSF